MRFYEVICEEVQPEPIGYAATFELAEHIVRRYKQYLDEDAGYDEGMEGSSGHSFEINHTYMAMTKEDIDEEFDEL
jgi:hypothetical protein